jgi:hypothetical protein
LENNTEKSSELSKNSAIFGEQIEQIIIELPNIFIVLSILFVAKRQFQNWRSNGIDFTGSCPHSLQDILTNTKGLFRENRQHLLQYFADQNIHSGVIYMTGKLTEYRNTDVEYLFRQESHYQ